MKQVWALIEQEMDEADARFGPFHSTHEGLGVLAEEYDELKVAIRANELEAIRGEAIQVAAVALRLVESLDSWDCRRRSLIE